MANSDHKTGRRPSSPPNGNQAVSPHALGIPSSAPAVIPEFDPDAVARWLMRLHEPLQKRDWVVIPWNARDPQSARVLTGEVRMILEAAVLCLGQINHRRMRSPTADA
ncbi:hypothetical protein DYST_02260 [Dyella terrae]|nr:hypothetical protein DYST_02260 [Dyella terrae]